MAYPRPYPCIECARGGFAGSGCYGSRWVFEKRGRIGGSLRLRRSKTFAALLAPHSGSVRGASALGFAPDGGRLALAGARSGREIAAARTSRTESDKLEPKGLRGFDHHTRRTALSARVVKATPTRTGADSEGLEGAIMDEAADWLATGDDRCRTHIFNSRGADVHGPGQFIGTCSSLYLLQALAVDGGPQDAVSAKTSLWRRARRPGKASWSRARLRVRWALGACSSCSQQRIGSRGAMGNPGIAVGASGTYIVCVLLSLLSLTLSLVFLPSVSTCSGVPLAPDSGTLPVQARSLHL